MLPTVGRGGDGQKVRDEILNIMHRHHIKEVSGHFLEEWHQKLHNNTTPDDIEICQAYLEFLRSDGNLDLFYKTLLDGGVERKRLQSFERPIKSDPTFHAHLKGGLIPDFEYFLKILKSVHAGADLETAIQAAKGQLDGEMQGLLASVWQKQNDSRTPVLELIEQITKTRRLAERLSNGQNVRDLLYLDLALEQAVRSAVEKNIHLRLSQEQLVQLFGLVLENVMLSPGDVSASEQDRAVSAESEFAVCLNHWQRLKALPNREADWPLHAKSVLDRVARALARSIDSTYQLLQPKAELLGKAFEADPWTITLFSEEVVRGQSLGFVLSMVLHHLEPLLRKAANLGDWQIISRGQGCGIVEVVESLSAVQGKTYDRPTVIIADAVMGDEEVPPGVTAVIAPDVTDIVSHVAVRARNAGLLFASCHDREVLQRLKSLRGRQLSLKLNPAGDVVFSEVAEEGPAAAVAPKGRRRLRQAKAGFTTYAVGLRDFTEDIVGMKSLNQLRLQQQLGGRVPQPKSAALPFGVFEHVLSLEANGAVRERTDALLGKLKAQKTSESVASILAEVRQALLGLAAPEELVAGLRAVLKEAGLAWPANWPLAWGRIKEVWASKWNERAYWSREAAGIAHEELRMAVLIQEVVEAEFAFVIHTANPITGQREQLLAEVVFGLGETLVGNYPGRAFSFVAEKGSGKQVVLSYPSKSVGLYGSGLIFRSDSNGEDLADYAGAGLYESVLLDPPRERILDYAAEQMLWDSELRAKLFKAIAANGIEVEQAFGAPQDIEGAFAQGKCYVVQSRPQVQIQ
jgi:alpha-glucan,water dikinase